MKKFKIECTMSLNELSDMRQIKVTELPEPVFIMANDEEAAWRRFDKAESNFWEFRKITEVPTQEGIAASIDYDAFDVLQKFRKELDEKENFNN